MVLAPTSFGLNCLHSPYSIENGPMDGNNMEVEVIYRPPEGSLVLLGVRKLADLPPVGKRFSLDQRQYLVKGFDGPDAAGRYRLELVDEPGAAGQVT
jgi:hypothetical protein